MLLGQWLVNGTNYWSIGLEGSLAHILPLWNWVKPRVISHYLGIPLGTGFFSRRYVELVPRIASIQVFGLGV